MQITATTGATAATTKTATGAATTSGDAFAQAMTTQTKAQGQTKVSADAVQVTARVKTSKTARVMHPILVPKAAALSQADGTAAAKRTPMSAAETRAAYGEGTLATILARIRRA